MEEIYEKDFRNSGSFANAGISGLLDNDGGRTRKPLRYEANG
jgi:hypothetical protein